MKYFKLYQTNYVLKKRIEKGEEMEGKLYVVGTPIGNLEDITFRAISILKEVDFIIAEDTRVTLKLLNRYGIKKKIYSNHKYSEEKETMFLVEKILKGELAALVSDAGTPCICDPGDVLVRLCREREIEVVVIPGACAAISALSISGIDSARFTFYGFLPRDIKERKKVLLFLKELNHIVVLYEAPHKLLKTLKDILEYFKDREIVLVKELTKVHELVESTTVIKAIEKYEKEEIKGEYVLIVKGAIKREEKGSLEEAIEFAKQLILNGEKVTSASKKAALFFNFSKGEIYKKLIDG